MAKRFLSYATVSMVLLCGFSFQAWALPQLDGTAIMAVSGTDADRNGYYETVSFELELHATSEAASSYSVAARIYCAATGQGWYTEPWTVTGSNSEKVFVVFNQSDFILSGLHVLDFAAELWDAGFATQYASTSTVPGGPVKAEIPSVDPPTVDAPPAPTLSSPTSTSMVLSVNGNGGPGTTLYSVRVMSDPVDPKRDNNYLWPLNGLAQRFDVPVWRPLGDWQNLLVSNPDLLPGTAYTFVVRAKYNDVETADGPAASLATLGGVQVAAPPAPVLSGPTQTGMILSVVGNGGPAGTEYSVGRAASSPIDSAWQGQYVSTTGAASAARVWATKDAWQDLQISDLLPGTAYTFAARARYSGVESADGPAASLATLGGVQVAVPPAPVLGSPTQTSTILSVVGNGGPVGTEYSVQCTASSPIDSAWQGQYVSTTGAASAARVWATEDAWQSLQITDLLPGTTYTFAARARYGGVESGDGSPASLSTLEDQPPATYPVAVLSNPTRISMDLSVEGAPGPEGTLYAVRVTSSPVDPKRDNNYVWPLDGKGQRFDVPVWRPIADWQGLTVTNPDLLSGTAYTFVVRAKHNDVETPNGPAASLATLGAVQVAVPPAPVLGSPTETSMILSVVGNGGPDGTEYSVQCTASSPIDSAWEGQYVSTTGVPFATRFWAAESAWQNLQISGLQPWTAYTFAVRARYSGAESADGPTASMSTLGEPPSTGLPVPVLSDPTKVSMILSLKGTPGPEDTLYCLRVMSDPVDPKRDNNYVWPLDGRGQRFDVPVWRTFGYWQNLLLSKPDLRPGTTYTFMARSKHDGVESNYGAPVSLSTLRDTPAQCEVLGVSARTISLALDTSGFPADTVFAVKCTGTEPTDTSYDQHWIGECGVASATPVWLTSDQLANIYAAGLQPLTTYTFAAQARYAGGAETPSGPAVAAKTAINGDINDDGVANILDLVLIRLRIGETWCWGVQSAAADLNGDGIVDGLDVLALGDIMGGL